MPPLSHKHAVIFYSRDGHTDQLAHQLAETLDADIFRIETTRYRSSPYGYLRAGFDSLTGRLPPIAPVPDLSGYASLSLGMPIWTSYPATPMRAYLAQRPTLPETVGMFATHGEHTPPEKAFEMARHLCGNPFVATMSVENGLDIAATRQRLKSYCNAILAAAGTARTA